MKIQIRARHIELTETLRAHVERRLAFALGRFGTRVGRVVVRFSDINGHRGGVDKRCQIEVGQHPRVRAEVTHSDPYAAVDLAAERVSRAFARALERDRERAVVGMGSRTGAEAAS
jgi:putative sigma-54 modulation protein